MPDYTDLPLDGLVVLTVVSKWMGSLPEWKPHLKEAMLRGYNMLHYTPLQQRGESISPYSISDQLAFDSELFGERWNGSREDGVKLVKEQLRICKEEYGLMSLTDVVLNHTANNTAWLLEHPEAGVLSSFSGLGREVDQVHHFRLQPVKFAPSCPRTRTGHCNHRFLFHSRRQGPSNKSHIDG